MSKRRGTRTEKRRRTRDSDKAFREFVLRLPIHHFRDRRLKKLTPNLSLRRSSRIEKVKMQDDKSVFEHLFTSSVVLYGYLLHDLLEAFSTGYIATDSELQVISESPREVAELDKRLGIAVFPT